MKRLIGELVKELRVERKMTQYELAQYAQVPLGTVSKLENNKANVTIETLEKVLNVFGYELSAKKKQSKQLDISDLI